MGSRGSGSGKSSSKSSGGGAKAVEKTDEEIYESWFEYETANLMKEYSATGKVPSEDMYGRKLSEQEKAQIKADTDRLTELSQHLTKDKAVYRGMVVENMSEFKVGKTITTDSLTATTTDKKLASTYSNAENMGFGQGVILKYESSNGIRGYKNQAETIMPKGESFRITKITQENGVPVVHLYQSKTKATKSKKK